jgi:hypothetical protein
MTEEILGKTTTIIGVPLDSSGARRAGLQGEEGEELDGKEGEVEGAKEVKEAEGVEKAGTVSLTRIEIN